IREELLKSHEGEKYRMEEQIALLKEQLEEARKDKNKVMVLLEDHSKPKSNSSDSRKIELLEATLEKFVQQEEERKKSIESRRKKRDAILKEKQEQEQRELEEAEASRGFWGKLFSSN